MVEDIIKQLFASKSIFKETNRSLTLVGIMPATMYGFTKNSWRFIEIYLGIVHHFDLFC